MSVEVYYANPWRTPEPHPELQEFMDATLRGEYILDDQEQHKRSVVANSLLFGITVMAPLLIKPSRAEASPAVIGDGAKVVVIGDSLTVGREKAGLEVALQGNGFEPLFISSYGGRPLVLPGCDTNPVKQACYEFSDGVREVLKASQQIDDADYVMLNLGTNDQLGSLQQRLERTIDTIVDVGSKQDGKPPIIIVPEIFGNNPKISSTQKDEVIHAVAATYATKGIKVEVPAYKEFVDSVVRPAGYMSSDEVHLTRQGYKSLIMYDVAQLQTLQKNTTPPIAPVQPETNIPPPVPPIVSKPQPVVPVVKLPLAEALASKTITTNTLPLVDEYIPQIVSDKPLYDINMVPLKLVENTKTELATQFAKPATEITSAPLVATVTTDLPQEKEIPFSPSSVEPQQPTASSQESVESLQEKARRAGIHYDPITGRAMTYFKSFLDPNEIPVPQMRHGFHEPRDLPDTDPYIHANTDWHAPEGTTFVSPVPAKVIRYDDQYPGQKKSVGNSLVLVMGTDTNGKPITIQATHFSEIMVNTGDIVMPGQPLAKSGETGIAYGAHDSVGMSSDGSLEPYTNLSHSLNPIEYFDFDYTCSPSAQDDSGELCASDGSPLALPVNIDVLLSLGLPEYNSSLSQEPVVNEPVAQSFATVFAAVVTDTESSVLPSVDDATSTLQEQQPVIPNQQVDNDVPFSPAEQPPTFINGIEPAVPTQPVAELPNVDTVVEPTDTTNVTDVPPPVPDIVETPPTVNPLDPTTEQPQQTTDAPIEPESPSPAQPEVDPNDATMGAVPKTIYDFFMAQGLTHEGTVGLMANLRAESGLNPTRAQNSWRGTCAIAPEVLDPSTKQGDGTKGQGFGLAQWTVESRQLALQAYADQTGRSWKDINVQLEYTMIELQSPYFDQVLEVLRTTTNIDEAASIVLSDFENPAFHNHKERQALAHEIDANILAGNFSAIDVGCD